MPVSPDAVKTFHALPARPQPGQVVTAWKNLLASYFPANTDFKITSEQAEPAAYQANNLVHVVKVEFGGQPVLVVLVNNPEYFVSHSARAAADEEIRALVKKNVRTYGSPNSSTTF